MSLSASPSADEFADRRRLHRRASFWRIAAIVSAALFVLVLAWRVTTGEGGPVAGPHIARVDIAGVIGNDEPLFRMLEDMRDNERIAAVVIHVDSPGGTAVGGEATYAHLREIAAEKPMVAQVETLAASAGYMIASAADHIVARHTSIVGSVGVIVQVPNVTGLLDKLGVEVRSIKSSPIKAAPSPLEPVNEEAEAMMQRMVLSSYAWFRELVSERRDLTGARLDAVADGSVFSGIQSVENGLVDALGGERAVEAYLKTRDVPADLPVVRYRPRRPQSPFDLLASGGEALGAGLRRGIAPEAMSGAAPSGDGWTLDGLLAVWQ